ncbi:hypothetical protein [Streptomyces zagrosensis]|uniref:Uncharacterized protein n=1 Tax=Streptomyces zagrosensis TaxID=1042984 RepID=A0A7W9Q7K0_9ACTN|nr:hypothetical protein [Streptomyces zagrosensis]MBB5935081.1 hypothetical protein [Streptomyces zagrosensis]
MADAGGPISFDYPQGRLDECAPPPLSLDPAAIGHNSNGFGLAGAPGRRPGPVAATSGPRLPTAKTNITNITANINTTAIRCGIGIFCCTSVCGTAGLCYAATELRTCGIRDTIRICDTTGLGGAPGARGSAGVAGVGTIALGLWCGSKLIQGKLPYPGRPERARSAAVNVRLLSVEVRFPIGVR